MKRGDTHSGKLRADTFQMDMLEGPIFKTLVLFALASAPFCAVKTS